MDLSIVDYSVEIPTRCSFVIEFIISKFLKAQHVSSGTPLIIRSSKLYLQPLVYIPIGDRPLPRLSGKWINIKLTNCFYNRDGLFTARYELNI